MDIRNIAIVAHVDHGKTTLVDQLLKADANFETHKVLAERAMDSNDQEKERGITIYAKNAAIEYKGTKINIVDTPGHADFGSEVERVLRTVDATVLLVDAYEGPMPQTKFVLRKSLELGLKVLVLINKIDKPASRPEHVVDLTFDLFAQLGASDEQLDFPYMYAIARNGVAIKELTDEHKDMTPFLDFVMEHVPAAKFDETAPFSFQPATLDYDSYLGRLGIGRIMSGTVKTGDNVVIKNSNGDARTGKISKLFGYSGMNRIEITEAKAGDIVCMAGIEDIFVGESVLASAEQDSLPAISIDPPALAMDFLVNNSPFAGREGDLVTTRNIRERLEKELETNVGLQVEFPDNSDSFRVLGRGEMHLAVLIETMRREGYELQVSSPEVIMQEIDGQKHEPIEYAVVNVADENAGKVIEALGKRKGMMKNMVQENGQTMIEFEVPTRGLLGFRSQFILLTKGDGTFFHSFSHFAPYAGEIEKRSVGSLISGETGTTTGYSLWKLQERGPLFVGAGTEVYEGMILGEHNQGTDLTVNPIKGKQLTNVRSSGADDAIKLTPPITMTLEKALEYIQPGEYVEATPKSIRIRKKYLTELERKRNK
ncbi:translational GTPase TypA [bacterium DOLZORAL124_38_8]|nr:MAG: translational GTPase TypA [bacterium DOLZORAL124_38_8]